MVLKTVKLFAIFCDIFGCMLIAQICRGFKISASTGIFKHVFIITSIVKGIATFWIKFYYPIIILNSSFIIFQMMFCKSPVV